MILQKMKQDAEPCGRSITQAVITVPAYSNVPAPSDQRLPVHLLVWKCCVSINEPTASALA